MGWEKAQGSPEGLNYQYRLRTQSGVYRHYRVRARPWLNPEGGVLEWVTIMEDVHERTALLEELKKSRTELQDALERQQRFVSDASHELRASLTSVRGNLELILRYPHMSDSDKLETLEDAEREAVCMGRLVSDLLPAVLGALRRLSTPGLRSGATGYAADGDGARSPPPGDPTP